MIGQEYLARKIGEKAVKHIEQHDKDAAETVERTVARSFGVWEIIQDGPLFVIAVLLNIILSFVLLIHGPFESSIAVFFLLLVNFACVLFAINAKGSLLTIRHGTKNEKPTSQVWAYCFRKAALIAGVVFTLATLLHLRGTTHGSILGFFKVWGLWLLITLALALLSSHYRYKRR